MLRFLTKFQLSAFPQLEESMFRDRAHQFHDRLGWEVRVDEYGFERDEYDACNPYYVIWELPGGRHGGSMRFLPTTGRTMVNEHFAHLLSDGRAEDPRMWECTRFCLAECVGPDVAAKLMFGAAEFGSAIRLTAAVGVFDARMKRIYSRLGWLPHVLGTSGHGRESISAGIWAFSEGTRLSLAARAGISPHQARDWAQTLAFAIAA